MKKRMVSLYGIICAGMLLFSGCTGAETEPKTSNNQINDTQSDAVPADQGSVAKNDPQDDAGSEKEEITVENTFTDANDMFTSADFSGAVSGCTETTCTIDANFASTTDGEADSGSVSVTFTDETIFQRALVDSQGRKYYLDDGDKSELKDDDFVLLFGTQQADSTYLADKIIMIEFNY